MLKSNFFLLLGRAAVFVFLSFGASTQALSQACNWNIEVCQAPKPYNTSVFPAATCTTSNCYRVYYHFYLVKDGSGAGPYTNDTPINLTSLNITGTLTTNPASGLSEVNVKESIACSVAGPGLNTSDPNSPILNYDLSSNLISYNLQSASGSPITYLTYGRMPLFVLAVDVFPGEQVSLSALNYVLELAGSATTVCSTAVSLCQTDIGQTIAQPTTSCGLPNFVVGNPIADPSLDFPNRKKVPVWVPTTTANFSWTELDFLMAVIPSSSTIPPPAIETGRISATDVKVYSAGGRLNGPDYPCCKPSFTDPQSGSVGVQWGPSNDCSSPHCANVTFELRPNPTVSTTECGNVLYFDLYANSTEKVDIQNVHAVFRVRKTGSFTLNTTLSTSSYCSPISGCIAVTEPSVNYLRIVYNLTGVSNLTVDGPEKLATIALNTSNNGCITGMTFLDATLTSSSNICIPAVYSGFSESNTSDDICGVGYIFQANAETVLTGASISDWEYFINQKKLSSGVVAPSNCRQSGTSSILPGGSSSIASACLCSLTPEQNVVLRKTNDYLNGVTTYDLSLISRHILGLESLPVNFKRVAADANMSSSITISDIVELRKLILGIYPELPITNSWRFVDKDFKSTIVDPNGNPFSVFGSVDSYDPDHGGIISPPHSKFFDGEFDQFTLPPVGSADSKAEFVGFKVGDVNGNALPSFRELPMEDRNRQVLTLGTQALDGRAGKTIEIPVFSLGQRSLSSWQMALNFDTTLLKVNGIRWNGDLKYGQDRDWHLAQPGELRLLWFDATGAMKNAAGAPLFFVQAQLLQTLPRRQTLIQLAANSIPQEAYDEHAQEYTISLEPSAITLLPTSATAAVDVQPGYELSVYPNPAGNNFRLNIEATHHTRTTAARLVLYDLLGRTLTTLNLELAPGLNTIKSDQLPDLAPGQYVVTLYTPAGVETLRLVKQ